MQLQEWIDDILIPSIVETCPNDVLQHQSRSYEDAHSKANVKMEAGNFSGGPIDVSYDIPEDCLSDFSAALRRRADQTAGFKEFAFLVLGHGMKLTFKEDSFEECRRKWFETINSMFYWTDEGFPPDEAWIDYGMEDTPVKDLEAPRVTLLRKRACIEDWLQKFHHGDLTPRTNEEVYTAGGTYDAASASVHLLPNNRHRASGMAYNKSYNVYKESFAAPYKDLDMFAFNQLEALGYDQALISEWYRQNSKYGPRGLQKLAELIAAYVKARNRLRVALTQTTKTTFGARSEYRILVKNFRDMLPPDEGHPKWIDIYGIRTSESRPCSSPIFRHKEGGVNVFVPGSTRHFREDDPSYDDGEGVLADQETHLPYYVVLTSSVDAYMGWQLSRWLYTIERLISCASCTVERNDLLLNGVMVSACIRIIRLCLGNLLPTKERSIWLRSWAAKRGGRNRDDDPDPNAEAQVDDAEEENGDGSGLENDENDPDTQAE